MQQLISGNGTSSELERTLLNWCHQCTQSYREVEIRNFTSSWRDGLAFNALIHYHRPDLFDYHSLLGRPANENLVHAFEKSSSELGISSLLDPQDIDNDQPDKKNIIMYIATMFDAFTRQKELTESDGSEEHQAARSDSPTPSSVSTMSEWEDYNETLTQVLAWLLQAENQLKQQEPVSDNVDKVKEQFREHEDFMMILTSHQTSVGSVLEFGSQLINEEIVQGKEEKDIRDQMNVLSERWENLRVSAMHRQTELHQHLMRLQQIQLQDLSNWLSKAEAEMEAAGAIGSDLEIVKNQVDKHKLFQIELENQQPHVNSLSHMVVVVDESESDKTTVDLENQLAVLGERWAHVCKWTEIRWQNLQEILISWQKYRSEENKLNVWLLEKENALQEISIINVGDNREVQNQMQKLKNLENELTLQQNSFGEFNQAAQRVAQMLDEESPAIESIKETMEDFNQRWNTIASMLNTKLKNLRGIDTKLHHFFQEIQENMEWIQDTEMLLQSDKVPQKDLVESLDQAVNKRRQSIIALNSEGDDIVKQSAIAGQSIVGLQSFITDFNSKWEKLSSTLSECKMQLDISERKEYFLSETQRILFLVTEITIFVEQLMIELKHNPKEMLIKIEIKLKELNSCKSALEKLRIECKEISDPTLGVSFDTELRSVFEKIKDVERDIKDQAAVIQQAMERTPPPEFNDKISSIQNAIEDIFILVSEDFDYNEVKIMKEVIETIKVKLTVLQEQDAVLKSLEKQQKEMFKGLSPDRVIIFQKQLSDVTRQLKDCFKICESRMQRVSEAIMQTNELETAMSDTFNWMDDVDKFLTEITGTIAEGDVETIESQIQEVEALQLDIETVKKKIDSLVETCTLIINRSKPVYSDKLKARLESLQVRWEGIISQTESQKENLRNASLEFQQIDNGIKDMLHYLKDVEKDVMTDDFTASDVNELNELLNRYQDIEIHLNAKVVTLKEYDDSLQKLVANGDFDGLPPQICIDLEDVIKMHALIYTKVKGMLEKIESTKRLKDQLGSLIPKQMSVIDSLDNAISQVSDELDGNDEDLQHCISSLEDLSKCLNSDDAKQIDEIANVLGANNVTSHAPAITRYEVRLHETKERYKKVENILEGELLKRNQLRNDIIQLEEWLNKVSIIIKEQITNEKEVTDNDMAVLKEEISSNEPLMLSVKKSVSELVKNNPDQHKVLSLQLETVTNQWDSFIVSYEKLKAKPEQKELEMEFSSLEGSALSHIDNLKRKVKKVSLISPKLKDIQKGLETLTELSKSCNQVKGDIEAMRDTGKNLFGDKGLVDRTVEDVEREFHSVKEMLNARFKLFSEAMPLSESVYTDINNLNEGLNKAKTDLEVVVLEPLPVTPEESIEIIQGVIDDIKSKKRDIENLFTASSQLRQMSDESAFFDLETEVHQIDRFCDEIVREGEEKINTLQIWVNQLDDYEKRVDNLNVWIDLQFSTLELIGELPAKEDIEKELQKLKELKAAMDTKESDLDALKSSGDEISNKGSSSIVDPFEKQIYQRWDDLEAKANYVQSTLEMTLKTMERDESSPPEKRRMIEINEVVIPEELNEDESMPLFDALETGCVEMENAPEISEKSSCEISPEINVAGIFEIPFEISGTNNEDLESEPEERLEISAGSMVIPTMENESTIVTSSISQEVHSYSYSYSYTVQETKKEATIQPIEQGGVKIEAKTELPIRTDTEMLVEGASCIIPETVEAVEHVQSTPDSEMDVERDSVVIEATAMDTFTEQENPKMGDEAQYDTENPETSLTVESGFPSQMDSHISAVTSVDNNKCAPQYPTVRINIVTQEIIPKKESLEDRVEDIIVTIETIEKNIENLKCDSTDVKDLEEGVQKLEDDLQELQPEFESLMEEANDTVNELDNDKEKKKPIMKLTRKISGVHNELAARKYSLQGAGYKLNQLNNDIMKVQLWLDDVEKAMAAEDIDYNFEDIEDIIEKNAAEMEGVNIRAEQLSSISTTSLIPRKQIATLNKRFKVISSKFEQFQRPEERVTMYKVSVQTGNQPNSDTRANVFIKLFGEYGNSDQLQLRQSETKRKKFQPGQVDLFSFPNEPWLGKLSKLRVWHDNEGNNPAWFLYSIYVLDELSDRVFCFVFDSWLSKGNGAVLKEIPVTAMGLSKEASPDFLIKKHRVVEMHWLFETLNSTLYEPILTVEDFVSDIKRVIETINGIRLMFKHSCFLRNPYDNLEERKKVLQEITDAIVELNPTLTSYMLLRNQYLNKSSAEEMHHIDMNLMNMRIKMNAVNKDLKTKMNDFEKCSRKRNELIDDMDTLTALLLVAEEQSTNEDEPVVMDVVVEEQNAERLLEMEEIMNEIIAQSSSDSPSILPLKEQMATLTVRWNNIKKDKRNENESMIIDDDYINNLRQRMSSIEFMFNEICESMFNTQPHPLIEDELGNYMSALKDIAATLPDLWDRFASLDSDIHRVISQGEISPALKEELKTRFEKIQRQENQISSGLENRKTLIEEKMKQAANFLEELEELSAWMTKTRELLEGQQLGKPGYSIDSQSMKESLLTRKSNVESINKLLVDFKVDGEFAHGEFPQDVAEKIATLNDDWKVISQLAITLKQEIDEEYIITESVQTVEESSVEMSSLFDDIDNQVTGEFDKNIAHLHDWLKLVEQKSKGLNVVVGDEDDMESSLDKAKSIQSEMEGRIIDLQEAIEMGAALNMDTNDEGIKYAVDDKVSKLKEHWDNTNEKIAEQVKILQKMCDDWHRYNEAKQQVVPWLENLTRIIKNDQRIDTTIEELEGQLKAHKELQEEIFSWSSKYNNLRQLAESLLQDYGQHDLTEFQTNVTEIQDNWNHLETIANARQMALQDALDQLLLFHKNMSTANTWLSDTESRVAGLDSHVEACQAEDSPDIEGIKQEMNELEVEISSNLPMFQKLNETSNLIIASLDGEVRTALHSKLDDMNDRWNSLGLHMVDIRDRIDGTGEWRQLLSDMQDIKDWLLRADKELKSQQPAGPYIESVQQQLENHELFKEKLNARKVVIEQSLDQGQKFLLKHQAQSEDGIFTAKPGSNLVTRAAANLQVQLAHVESQWEELINSSNQWERTLLSILELADGMFKDIDFIGVSLSDLEGIRERWQPVSEINDVHLQLEEVKDINERGSSLEENFDNLNRSVKELQLSHNIPLSKVNEILIDELLDRWKQLLADCQVRPQNMQSIMAGDMDHQTIVLLQGSVAEPWERSQSLNKVPYFINHDTKTTQWDHPKMTELANTLAELNDVKFAAYRTSMKLRCIQKACCLDLVELHNIIDDAFTQHELCSNNEDLIDVGEMIAVLVTIFENVVKSRKDVIIVPQCIDMTLNWLLNVYDSGRIGRLRILSFKVGIVLLCRAKLEEKWKYLFQQIADEQVDSKKLGLLLHDCVQVPRQLGEIAAFGGSNIEPSVRSCFEKVKNEPYIAEKDFLTWTSEEPQSLVWMPVLHRLAAAETAKHEAKCNICKEYPIVGFRYRCLKCFNYDLCQNCFWSGRISNKHRVTHPMHQYSLATTTGEDMSDFVKLMKNKFKSRRYRSRPPKKLGYLPVQTIMEGSNIETPSLPITPTEMIFGYSMNNGSISPVSERFRIDDDINEEHRLIQQMCQTLNGGNDSALIPKSPSQILKSLDREHKEDIDELINGLEEEHQSLLSEYNRLKGIQADVTSQSIYTTTTDSSRDAELIQEASVLRQHKGRLESRMQILEDHNRQLEAQLQRLRQLLEQSPSDRERLTMSIQTPTSASSRVTPALTPSSSYHGSPELARRDPPLSNGFSSGVVDFHHVTSQIEHAFPAED